MVNLKTHRILAIALAVALLVTGVMPGALAGEAADEGMTVEVYQTSSRYDMGIDCENVRIGWRTITGSRGMYQSAYHITVADEKGASAYDSGWVESDKQTGIEIQGLKPETIYICTVAVKDQNGKQSESCKPLTFETAPENVEGEWLGSAKLLRKTFTLDQPLSNVARARCYMSSAYVMELRMNGAKIGNLVWNPKKAVSDIVTYYNTFDITDMLVDGANAVGAYVSDNSPLNHQLCGMIRITYKDGTQQTVATGSDWKACTSC